MATELTLAEAHALLDAKPTWITLTTIGANGYPHTVPIGHFRIGDDIYIGCRAGTQKIRNIERNPKVSVMMHDGRTMQDIKGVLMQGDATAFTSPEDTLRLMREAAKLRGVPDDQLPTESRPGTAFIRVQPRRVISWDYSR